MAFPFNAGYEYSGTGYAALPTGVPSIRPDYLYSRCIVSDAGSRSLRNRQQPSVTSVAFDHNEELLWIGNGSGHVTSYYVLDMIKYTSFQVHISNDIRAQLTGRYGLLSLTKNSLRMSIRRGLTVYDLEDLENMKDMYYMSGTENPDVILIGGQQNELLEFNINTSKIVRTVKLDDVTKGTTISGISEGVGNDTAATTTDKLPTLIFTASSTPLGNCMIIRTHPKFVCLCDASGKITLRDKSSMRPIHQFSSHNGQLSDFDVRGNYLVTCGASVNRSGIFTIDRFLMVYDLRMLKAITPIGMNFAPFFLRFVPIYASKFVVVSSSGQFQLLDAAMGTSQKPPPFLHKVELFGGATLTSFDVSHSSQALAFGDSHGNIHLFGASSDAQFNVNSQPTEFADTDDRIVPNISYDDYTIPFSMVPPMVTPSIPDCRESDRLNDWIDSLFSTWPSSTTQKNYRRIRPIDSDILSSSRITGGIRYAANPKGRGRFFPIYDTSEYDRPEPTLELQNESDERKDNGENASAQGDDVANSDNTENMDMVVENPLSPEGK